VGTWLLMSGLGQTPIISKPEATSPAVANQNPAAPGQAMPAVEEEAGIPWQRSFVAAQQLAKATGKPIFIDFFASWCANCIAFKKEAASNKALNEALRNKAVPVKLVDKEPEFEQFREHPEHRQLKIGLPYFAILSPDGKLLWSGTDYTATAKMVEILTN